MPLVRVRPSSPLLVVGLLAGCLPGVYGNGQPDGGSSGGSGAAAGIAGALHDPAQNVAVTALIPTYAATSIASFTSQTQNLEMPMKHTSSQVPGNLLAACSTCHLTAGAGAYRPGNLHSTLANMKMTQPLACLDCHASSAPTGFVGQTAANPARTPASGEMKHDAVAWASDAPTATKLVTQDCGVCHAPPSQSSLVGNLWAAGKMGAAAPTFHAALTAGKLMQPGSCIDCHANTRPSGVLTAANATLPNANLQFDHSSAQALGECTSCHTASASSFASWKGGQFHQTGAATPATCLPCHSSERPTSTAGWVSTSYTASPFDYGTNSLGITHGHGQDCASCHNGPGTGAWGGTQNWVGGKFNHGPTTVSGTTCIACHTTQRPDLQPGVTASQVATAIGFDHSLNGTGDCYGCHQATATANTYVNLNPIPGGDWKGGQAYPGSTLISSSTQSITETEITLNRSGANNLVTSTSSQTVKLFDQMLHISTALPAQLNAGPTGAPDNTKCWHCHTSTGTTVTAYADGKYHTALTNYSATPGGAVTPFPQPSTQCTDCHTKLQPVGIVEKGASNLVPMDHNAAFTAPVVINGSSVGGVSAIDCAACHTSPGTTWTDGVFHAKIAGAVPKDCTTCHYPLMVDTASADLTSGTSYKMTHASAQVTFQNCQNCHTGALAGAAATPNAPTQWQGGVFHPALSAQPSACGDCHTVSLPTVTTASSWTYALAQGSTATNSAQYMNHASSALAGIDCAGCHAADAKASGAAWSKSDFLHVKVPAPATCQACHGTANGGGSTPGTNNNLPAGLTDSSTLTVASKDATTGIPAGTHDQIDHADVNVTGHDCNHCHTQVGIAAAAPVKGKEWAQAAFHLNFGAASPLVMNGTTGRCSSCHLNVKPGASFTAFDHSGLTNASGSQDCSACHSWPGTGTATSPNWLGAAGGYPPFLNVGGFAVSQPPAAGATTQAGISNLPHPTPAGLACTACHSSAGGGKMAIGYDHASALMSTNCASCHEAGSNLVGTVWNGATVQPGAGDTRPWTLTQTQRASGAANDPNHFYPIDCSQCHNIPAGTGTTTTGGSHTQAWNFPHNERMMSNPSTCQRCHKNGIP